MADRLKFLLINPTAPQWRLGESRAASTRTQIFRFSMLSGLYVAAALPAGVSAQIVDEEVDVLDFDTDADLIGISFMTFNAPRAYRIDNGVPYTQSSNLVAALDTALAIDWPRRWETISEADRNLRDGLRRHGFAIVAADDIAMPGVISVALPPDVPAARLASRMARSGFLLAGRSDYLARRNWVQICLMGTWNDRALEILPEILATQARACVERARQANSLGNRDTHVAA